MTSTKHTTAPLSRGPTPLSVSVVVITWNRPDYVERCLEHLDRQRTRPKQVLVVDASPGEETAHVVSQFPQVTRIAFPAGAGHMTRSRNESLLHASGDVIAFLDDDAFARPEWHTALLRAYQDPTIAALVGRTCNGRPGEERVEPGSIGRLLADGTLTGNFAADSDHVVEVDHGIGANMSFRRDVLARLGGFRDDYPGTALREDTDMFLRIKKLGLRSVFTPAAVVDHVAAPHVKGRRFDWRYQFWGNHNHLLLLARHFGLRAPVLWHWAGRSLLHSLSTARLRDPRSLTRPVVALLGICLGGLDALRSVRHRRDVVRTDETGRRISASLSISPHDRQAPCH